jgi:nucleotide-binding universal stress UspA family protein
VRLLSVRPRASAERYEARPPVIVCGVDDASVDYAVVFFAAHLVERCGGRPVILQTQPSPLIYAEPQVAFALPQQPQPTRDLVATAGELARLAAAAGVAPKSEVRVGFGDPEKRLLATARDEQAALLIVGTGDGSEMGKSRAVRVISGAPCPVVVVPVAGIRSSYGSLARTGWGRQRTASASASTNAVSVTSTNGGHVTSSILCGIDGSHQARLALRHAARLAPALGVRLVVAHVVQLPLPSPRVGGTAGEPTDIPIDALLKGGEAILEKLLEEEGLGRVERRVMLGFPADCLADLADDEAAELIVVGSRGRGALKRALLGSVSSDLIGVARCPVLVVPPRAERSSGKEAETPAASVARAA